MTDSTDERLTLGRLAALSSVPRTATVAAALASSGALTIAVLDGLPAWAITLAAFLPWGAVLATEALWIARRLPWLALFYVVAVSQLGHVGEHVAQMVQIHVQHADDTRGIFGALDIEWVHFIWNTWVGVAVVALLLAFRSNPWLWAAAAFALWHEAEHVYILVTYLDTGVAGTPGLLADGGALAGGVGLPRPDLHFAYNLLETAPLVAGFVYELRHVGRKAGTT